MNRTSSAQRGPPTSRKSTTICRPSRSGISRYQRRHHPDKTATKQTPRPSVHSVTIPSPVRLFLDKPERSATSEGMALGQRLFLPALLSIFLLGATSLTWSEEPSSLGPRSGNVIQQGQTLPSITKQDNCNPAATYCQLSRRDIAPTDSDLTTETASGSRLEDKSSLNHESRTGARPRTAHRS